MKIHAHDSVSNDLLAIPGVPASLSATRTVHTQELAATFLTQRIAEKAATHTGALALSSRGRSYTYAELEAKANGLAATLQSRGVGVGSVVGVCLESGPGMVFAALGAMQAGAAYLPLEPEYPTDRLRYMLADASVRVLVTSAAMVSRLPAGSWQLLVMDDEGATLPSGDRFTPVAINWDDLAYVVYTSGSSGRPKGVQITHSGLTNLIAWHLHAFQTSPADRTSQIASFGFDAAAWEIWPNLAAGASVHFPSATQRTSPQLLRDWLLEQKITVAFAPTPLAEALLRLDWPDQASLRLLLTGGDTLHSHPPAGLPFVLVNNYGPTECTVVATSAEVLPSSDATLLPPIGRPIDNLTVHILDEEGRAVTPGQIGELYIAGPGVARGYLNQPQLDAEKFLPDAFSSVSGQRMYRTGDLGRYLPDGQIAFAGRVDDQIKIRGFRIEPDEIAAILNQHPEIDSSIILARDHSSLIAYVTADPGAELTHQGLQTHLRKTLPEYMIPSVFVRLEALPLGETGKVDRSALPEPSVGNMIGDQTRTLPQSAIEFRVVEILSELLSLAHVSVQDNFFFLGGHSLLGTQLISRVRDSFGVELPLRSVFDLPTAEQLSTEIERLLQHSALPTQASAD